MNRLAQRTFQISRSAAFRFVLGFAILGCLVALPSASSTKINPKISTDLQAYAAVNAAPLAPLALSFTVDRNDDNPSATLCTVAPNDCSLRGAIIAANANLGADTIIFDPATNGTPFTLTAGPADNEFAGTGATQASGDLDIVDDLTITGNGAALTVIDGNNLDRIIDVNNFNGTNTSTRRALTVVIDGVTLRNGDAKAVQVDPGPPAQFFNHSGGAIRFDGVQAATTVRGSLTVTNSIITTNRAAAQGGGIQAINCSLTLNNDQVLNNQATTSSSGGVLYNAATTAGVRTLTITNSTISNNRALTAALGSGGGINIAGTATVNINGNTIAGNQAGANGGGIFANVSATTAKTYSKNKITGNSANQGGAIFNTNGSLALNYNLIVGNSTTALVSSSFHSTAGTVTATDDWWGCNQGPNNPSSLCDKMTGAVEPNYLVLRHNATPNTILVNTSASLQADFYTDSAGAVILPVNLVALEGRPIVFNNAVLGTISGADTQISNGKANATYTAGSTGGTGSADATVDHATVTAFINIQAAAAVTVNPTDQTACEGGSVTFTAASSGFPPPTVQWQVSSGGGPFTDIPGATSNTLTFTANISQDGNKYRAVFTNAGGSATSSAATLTVNSAPTVTTNPTDATVCAGAIASFTAAANGKPAPSVQWQVSIGGGPFANLPGETNNTLSFTASAAQNGNKYRAVFSNTCGSANTTAATLTVNGAASTTDPADKTVCQGAMASFSTTASGTGPFHYAWTLDGSTYDGDSASITVDTTSLSVGNHSVVVTTTGACGSSSQTATLTVQENTATSDPADSTVCQGATASFSTTASGTGPFHYAWTLDGSPFNGDSSSINVPTGSLSVGSHSVTVTTTGVCGSASQSATLTVQANTTTTDPADATLCQGATASFSTTAGGTGPFSYAWTIDGSSFGGDTSTINVPTGSLSVGFHTVTVTTSGACASASQSATLTVQENTTATTPNDQTVCQGATAGFSTTASGNGPLSYAWTVDGTSYGGNTSSISVPTGSLSIGSHPVTVTVTGTCGSVTRNATLNVQENTTATTPDDQTVCQGATAGFSTTASGNGPLSYAWTVDGSSFGGNTSSISVPTGSLSVGNHSVSVTVSGGCGSVTRSATLTVQENTTATTPNDQTVCQGATAGFSTTASGNGPLSYAWTVDGSSYGGNTSSISVPTGSLSVGNHPVTVTVSGGCGNVIRNATLTVQENTTATTPNDQTVCQGATADFSTTASGTNLSYAWTVDGSSFGGNTSSISVPTGSLSIGSHSVSVTVSGACGNVTRNATLNVQQNTSATTPGNQTVCQGAMAAFSTTASGNGTLHYAWTVDGSSFGGDTSSISVPTGSMSVGNHPVTVTVSGTCGSVTKNATLTVNANTSTSDPPDVATCEGSTVSFTTTASGTGPFSFAWTKNGLPVLSAGRFAISNTATTSTLTISNVQAGDAGTYMVETSGACGTASQSANLSVDSTPPTIILSGQTISLWPPNHKYETVNVTDLVSGVSDSCDSNLNANSVTIASVTSDELEDSPNGGDGNTLKDIVISCNRHSVQLRAERDGNLNGRVYTIIFTVTDSHGHVGTATAKVTVPLNQSGAQAIDSGPHYTVTTATCP